ncbi:MAG: hypothetical protein WD060_14295 [Pirellulales bacterium]
MHHLFDPIDQVGNWSDNPAFLPYQTQSPATSAFYPGQVTAGMDDRFDFQLVTGAWLDGRGLDYIPGSYWAFGNTHARNLNQAITTGSPSALQAYLPDYSQSQASTILTNLSRVSDHLPVVADSQIPAKLSASLRSGTVSVVATSPQTAAPTFSQSVTMSVLDHAIGSFSQASTLATLDIDFGTQTQGTGTASQGLSIFNRPGTLGASWTARLKLDGVSSAGVSGVFSTTLSPFLNLAPGSSRALCRCSPRRP